MTPRYLRRINQSCIGANEHNNKNPTDFDSEYRHTLRYGTIFQNISYLVFRGVGGWHDLFNGLIFFDKKDSAAWSEPWHGVSYRTVPYIHYCAIM